MIARKPLTSRVVIALIVSAAIVFPACAGSQPDSNANSTAPVRTPAESTPSLESKTNVRLSIIEPERYSATITINAQAMAGPFDLTFNFAKIGSDRRAVFQLLGIGQAVYLEKSGIKYFIVPGRNQYCDLSNEVSIIKEILNPIAIAERLRSNSRYESLSEEMMDGRTVTRFRLMRESNEDTFLYVDLRYSVPIRSELSVRTADGATTRMAIALNGLDVLPDPSLFEVPSGLTRVTSARLATEVRALESLIRPAAEALRAVK